MREFLLRTQIFLPLHFSREFSGFKKRTFKKTAAPDTKNPTRNSGVGHPAIHRMHRFAQMWHLQERQRVCRMGEAFTSGGVPCCLRPSLAVRNWGTRLFPHRFTDDRYDVHLGKEGPYIPVTDYRDIPSYLANGYSLQMSDRPDSHTPSLKRPGIDSWMESKSLRDLAAIIIHC